MQNIFKKEFEDIKNIYNIKNRGIDVFDQYLSISLIQRKCKKWYKKVLLFEIDASIINSKIIIEKKLLNTTTEEFKTKIIDAIFKMYQEYKYINIKKEDNNNNSNYIPILIGKKIHNIGHIKQRN